MTKTKFDDCKWLGYDEALELSKKIYQPGKKRITIYALNKLKELSLLD